MEGLVHKRTIKVNDKVVLESVKRLPSLKTVAVENRATLVSELASSLNHDLMANGSPALQMLLKKPKAGAPRAQKLADANQNKQREVKNYDFAMKLNQIEDTIRKLRESGQPLHGGKYSVEGLTDRLMAEVTKMRTVDANLNLLEQSQGKDEVKILKDSGQTLKEKVSGLNKEINIAKGIVKKKQQQLAELEGIQTKLDKRLKSVQESRANLLKLEQEDKEVEMGMADKKRQLEKSRERFSKLEQEVRKQIETNTELENLLKSGKEKIAVLRLEIQECEKDDSAMSEKLAEIKKSLDEKTALRQELDTSLLDLDNAVKEAATLKECKQKELDTLKEEAGDFSDKFDSMNSLLKEVKKEARAMEISTANQRKKKSDLVKEMEDLDAKSNMLDKQICELKAMLVRKSEDRTDLQKRVLNLTKASTQKREDLKAGLLEMEQLKKQESHDRTNKTQLFNTAKRVALEKEKLQEAVSKMTTEKEALEDRLDKLQADILNLSEAEVAAKVEHAAAVERVQTIVQVVSETKAKVDQLQEEKEKICEELRLRMSEMQALKDNKDENIYCAVATPVDIIIPARIAKNKGGKWFGNKKKQQKDDK